MSGPINRKSLLPLLSLVVIITMNSQVSHAATPLGTWKLLKNNIGIVAMHMQLLPNNRVVIFDRTDFGVSNISLPNGACRLDTQEAALKTDCSAHSVEYDVIADTLRPLTVLTDTWCSSGALMPNGTLAQTGGYKNGEKRVRLFTPCSDTSCDWLEMPAALNIKRWYATNQALPDGTQIVVGGIDANNYEYYPKTTNAGTYNLAFLGQTWDAGIFNNLYPFVFLNTDGNLFVFNNNRAILLSYKTNTVLKTYPTVPGGHPRNYPSTGSAVLLPLTNINATNVAAEVLVCGGAPNGSYTQVTKNNKFVEALNTCARMKINDPNPQWEMDTMPLPRVMGDMTMLLNGDVLIINGCANGTAGWELGRNPVLSPVVYHPDNALGSRFDVENPSTIPRMYHSTAISLPDGRVLVGGSNAHALYQFGSNVLFPTELRLEAFYPSYLDASFDPLRPKFVSGGIAIGYNKALLLQFRIPGTVDFNAVSVTMTAPPFTTHSFSMNQRQMVLPVLRPVFKISEPMTYRIQVQMPPNTVIAPPGYYMVSVVHQKVPSPAIWIQLK